MNVTLIGMPGSGKTFVGKILAETLGFEFFDSDIAIEQEYGRTLPEILQNLGPRRFLQKEKKAVIANTRGKDKLVISPGGSIVYSEKAMEHLKTISAIVYLKTALPVIKERIGSVPRGIVGGGKKTIARLFGERSPLYEKWAETTVDANQNAVKVVHDILEKIQHIKKITNPTAN